MASLKTLLTSIGLGAGIMYFFDPSRGDRRRAMVRDRFTRMRNEVDNAIMVGVDDLRNRTRGVLAEGMAMLSTEESPDWIVEERVRAELGRLVSHPRALEVSVNNGTVTLSGPVLQHEADYLLKKIARVRGVKSVENHLQIHAEPGDVPGLQGGPSTGRMRPEWQQENWSPSMRLLSGMGGSMLALYGMFRRGLVGSLFSLAGLGLAARGVLNLDLRSMLGMKSAPRLAVNINKAININAPVEDIYKFWSNFENFPRFMAHVKEVRSLGENKSHWKVAGPAGYTAEWDAVMTRNIPNQEIAWESIEDSEVKTSGRVHFQENARGGTRVTVHLNYTPPAGAVGHAAAMLFGADPKSAMDEDLARLKSLFETGKTTVQGREVTGEELGGAESGAAA